MMRKVKCVISEENVLINLLIHFGRVRGNLINIRKQLYYTL